MKSRFTVYPRYREEHIINYNLRKLPVGLSPLPRGTLAVLHNQHYSLRFIPATAGNTLFSGQTRSKITVYPRYRGEHRFRCGGLSGCGGLSPLPRGTLHRVTQHDRVKRFIPATAGNTQSFVVKVSVTAVYPRYRGEHENQYWEHYRKIGLSPLPRGTRPSPPPLQNKLRFIPATAGNTVCPFLRCIWIPVYPRYRGEHLTCRSSPVVNVGLSPLPRGTLMSEISRLHL